jgi:murein DD-endopeptidase MepM/ murein hydrolase activator NlpD
MTKTIIGWMFLIFCGLVFINYLGIIAGNFFSPYGGFAHADQSPGRLQLAAIDFNLFNKGGEGKNYITQGYGRTPFSYVYKNGWHNGIDIAAVYGAPVYSPGEGVVIATGNQDNYCPRRGFGRYVAVNDGANNLILWYAHLGKISVAPGDTVKVGTTIGTVGSSGYETGTHLHLSIFDENRFFMTPRNGCGPDATGKDLNPLSYLGTTYK